ncbi:MAG TPA: glycosyltransferase family 4 protein [Bryobacteraceae bacterium]|nr:glycosyltransferase family 4 protein [Bryobacteraceae bacterium]
MNNPWVIIAAGLHQKGGMDKANFALADYLLERETPVHIVTHSVDPSLQQHPLATVQLVTRPLNSFYLGEFTLAARGRQIARRILGQNPGAQVVSNGGNCIWPGINWAHYVHRAWEGPKRGPLAYRIKAALAAGRARRTEKAAFQRARLIISNSQRTTNELVKFFGVDPSRVHTVYLGSDQAWGPISAAERAASRKLLQVSETRSLAVFVGALGYDDRKGFDVLFRAFEILCSRPDWDVDLMVAGGGPATPEWQAKVKQAGLENRIRLLGFTDQVKSVLAAADLLISPVRYESYGLNVQEAICRGVPAMVSASAGVAEQYDSGFSPLLLPDPENAADIVQRLEAWRANREQWRARFQPFGDRLRARSWRDTAADFVSIVENQRPAKANGLSRLDHSVKVPLTNSPNS